MKRTILNVCILTCLAASYSWAQTAGGSAGAGAAGAGAGAAAGAGTAGAGAAVNGGTGGAKAGATINGGAAGNQTGNGTIPNRGGLPNKNGFQNGQPVNQNQNGQPVNQNGQPVNRAGGTNNLGDNNRAGNTNQFASNTNSSPLARSGMTNRMTGTNQFAGTNFNTTNSIAGTNGSGLGPQDMATSEFDRALITKMRQTIMQKLGGTSAAWAPVSINSQNGVVTLMGTVPSVVLKQRAVTTIQGTPGIVRVVDQLTVDPNAAFNTDTSAQAPGTSPQASGNTIQPLYPVNPSQPQRPVLWNGNPSQSGQPGQPALSPTGRPTNVPQKTAPTNSAPSPSSGFTTNINDVPHTQ